MMKNSVLDVVHRFWYIYFSKNPEALQAMVQGRILEWKVTKITIESKSRTIKNNQLSLFRWGGPMANRTSPDRSRRPGECNLQSQSIAGPQRRFVSSVLKGPYSELTESQSKLRRELPFFWNTLSLRDGHSLVSRKTPNICICTDLL